MEPATTFLDDLMLYGGAFLFVAVLFFALSDGDKKKKNKQLTRATTGASHHSSEGHKPEAKTLRKELNKDNIPLISLFTRGEKGFVQTLRIRLETAGLALSAEKYLAINAGLAFAVLAVVSGLFFKPLMMGILAGLAAGMGLPHLVVSRKIKARQKKFLLLFPDAIDLIVRGLRAGLPVTQSMQNVAEEINEPVQSVFRDISDQMTLGVTFEKALETTAAKLNLTEFNFFITSIILQRETGGNLGEILGNLSEVLRNRQTMRLKIKAMSSEAKASAIIVGALPFFVFGVLNVISPDYIEPLYSDFRGNMAMLGAACSMGFGAFIMSKMTRFEI